MTESEANIAAINSSYFFKEFTFSSNKFKKDEKGEELELADNVIWLDDFLMITQIKERNSSINSNIENWFKNKVLRRAVKQIKDTVKYFEIYDDISIPNEKGHVLNISEAKKIVPIKLIIYSTDGSLPESLRFLKFYESNDVGLIHLFHLEDYLWICKYLVTPAEIREYLSFRRLLFENQKRYLNELPEQYVLGHYLETLDVSIINPRFIENLKRLIHDEGEFDISFIIENFKKKIRFDENKLDYYAIIKELAKLNRADLREFKKRYLLAIEKSKEQKFTKPFRITSLNIRCGFVFIPLEFVRKDKWLNALINYTEAHKYDQKLNKCIGMIVYQHPEEKYFDVNWCYIVSEWEYNAEFEKLLKENYPFREVNIGKTFRYYMNEDE
jgi:hypothetical protein